MNKPHEAALVRADTRVKITRVETIPVRMPMRTPFKISSGAARPYAEVLIVRLHTDQGLVGIGETQAWRRQGSSETLTTLTSVIQDFFTPLLIGQSPFSLPSILEHMEEAIYKSLYAQAAVADALYDLQGRILGVPVYQLLGGQYRDRLAGCAVLSIKPSLEETLAGAQAYYDKGYRSFTVKIGVDPKDDERNVRALRERLGSDVIIRVDANAGMEFDGALALLKKLEPYDLDAAEQMLPLWDVDGMAELARRVTMPLMADECVATDHDLINVIKKRAATVMQSKVAKNGGLWRMRKLWCVGSAAGMRIFPGNHPSTSIATSSVLHLAASWPGPLLEGPFNVGLNLFDGDIVTEPLRMDGPNVHLNDGPGWGLTLDEDRIRHLRVDK
jgi:L-alanine-DL-glutamate epimerase-like enolase superfamily enzyme